MAGAGAARWIEDSLALENKLSTFELVADLVETAASHFSSELERMFTAYHRHVVQPLERMVPFNERASNLADL